MVLHSLTGIIAVAVMTFAAAAEPKWVTYRSPSGFYSVDHPSDWKVERDENIVNIIPVDESGAVTISAYIGKAAPSHPERLISEAFGAQQPISPLLTVTGSGWKGVRQTFLDKSQTPHRELVVIIARNASGMVIITWNEVSPSIPERAPIYGRIFDSLKLSTRKPDRLRKGSLRSE
jgi:hypothetical protein